LRLLLGLVFAGELIGIIDSFDPLFNTHHIRYDVKRNHEVLGLKRFEEEDEVDDLEENLDMYSLESDRSQDSKRLFRSWWCLKEARAIITRSLLLSIS